MAPLAFEQVHVADVGAITSSCDGEPDKCSDTPLDQAVLSNTNAEIKLISHAEGESIQIKTFYGGRGGGNFGHF